MPTWLIKSCNWIKINFKLVLLVTAFILLFLFIFWISNKNKKIRSLENNLRILKAKIDLEKLALKNEVKVEELKELKKENDVVKEELNKIEKNLQEKLENTLSAEEIVKKFKELGL